MFQKLLLLDFSQKCHISQITGPWKAFHKMNKKTYVFYWMSAGPSWHIMSFPSLWGIHYLSRIYSIHSKISDRLKAKLMSTSGLERVSFVDAYDGSNF